jgi:DNA repair photolyase
MVNLQLTERKSAVLSPSSLACLCKTATINLTSGCAHNCIYCYTKGYSSFPGESTVRLYTNTADKLERELSKKRVLPQSVYFSPSSDLFQPIPEVLAMGLRVLKILLDWGIGVAFLTKGMIPEEFFDLFANHPNQVQAGIGLITTNHRLAMQFEPGAASVATRLEQAKRLVAMGVPASIRADPIIPGVTDDDQTLDDLCAEVSATGVCQLAASLLFFRPAIMQSLNKALHGTDVLKAIQTRFEKSRRLPIHAEHSMVTALPVEERKRFFDRLKTTAERYGLKLYLCTCKNPDLSTGSCRIAGNWNVKVLFE